MDVLLMLPYIVRSSVDGSDAVISGLERPQTRCAAAAASSSSSSIYFATTHAVHVAGVLVARLSAYKEPAEAPRAGFDKVPGVEGAGEGAPAERAAHVARFPGEAGAGGV